MTEEKPIDDIEMFSDASIDSENEYVITKDSRNIMLLCIGITVLGLLKEASVVFFRNDFVFSPNQNIALSIIYIITTAYYYYFLYKYFIHYQLVKLSKATLVILISDVAGQIIFIANSLNYVVYEMINSTINILALVILIIWLVAIFKVENKKISGIISLKNSARSMVISFVLSMALMAGTMFNENWHMYLELFYLPLIIPYYFIIEFTLKLKAD